MRQTLLVRREGKSYGVIAGRRRFFALKEIAKETGKTPLVPCAIMTEKDAVKCRSVAGANDWFLRFSIEVGDKLDQKLINILEGRKSG